MVYHTVFDVTRVGFQWPIPLLMFVFASLFVIVGWAIKNSGDRESPLKGLLFQGVGVVGMLAAIAFFVSMHSESRDAKKALLTLDHSVAEGVVTEFIPMPPEGHSTESFVVNGIRFQYGGGWGSTVFNSEWNTGFIHNGAQVRITYRDSSILKVEIKK